MSLFGDYIKERLNKEIVESDVGLCTYFFVQDGVYIEDLYVRPEYRKGHIASELADQVAEIARQKGYTKMYGSVVPSSKGSTSSLKVLLAYGMELESAQQNAIIMSKGI